VLLLLGSFALFTPPALAEPAGSADLAFHGRKALQVEQIEFGARRKLRASYQHVRRAKSARLHRKSAQAAYIRRARAPATPVQMQSYPGESPYHYGTYAVAPQQQAVAPQQHYGAYASAPRGVSRVTASRRSRVVPMVPGDSQPAIGGTGVVAEARRWIGTNPTGRSRLWCATFMNFVLERSGHRSSGSNLARSFASYGRRLPGPQVGAIAVMSRGSRGGHVGVVSGIDEKGNPIIISGNHGRRVAEAVYPRGRIFAYVMP
jgi:uncharacterized protein (TIGR02594 family)